MAFSPHTCPNCGSHDVVTARDSDYSFGLGCLGYLLFSWIGLLLGLLGPQKVLCVCKSCGHTFEPLNVERAGCCGCLLFLLLLALLTSLFA